MNDRSFLTDDLPVAAYAQLRQCVVEVQPNGSPGRMNFMVTLSDKFESHEQLVQDFLNSEFSMFDYLLRRLKKADYVSKNARGNKRHKKRHAVSR